VQLDIHRSLIERTCREALLRSHPFQNEVNHGGFHQFFFNSSGSCNRSKRVTFNEPRMLEFLHPAKHIVFPEIAVRMDTRTGGADWMNKLNELDQR
jgi:hypothetical protein